MKVVSDKDLFVSTAWGANIWLKAGVEAELGQQMGLRAIELGATHITAVVEKVVIEPKQDSLVTVLEKLMDEGNPKDFKTDGYPKNSVVKSKMGKAYTADEISEAWESVLNSQRQNMTVSVDSVVDRVQTILQDTTGVRWPVVEELVLWINDAQREIALMKPDASARNEVVTLVEGTKQDIPTNGNRLLRVIRNMSDATASATGKRAVRIVQREVLDSQTPNWHDETSTGDAAHSNTVIHYIYDEENPRNYYVFPGVEGNAYLEIVYSANPATVIPGTAPDWAQGTRTYDASNPEYVQHKGVKYKLIASTASTGDEPGTTDGAIHWQVVGTVVLTVPDIYANAIMNYVLYMAYMKDADFAANAQRAATHFQLFTGSVQGKSNTDDVVSPNQKAATRASSLAGV